MNHQIISTTIVAKLCLFTFKTCHCGLIKKIESKGTTNTCTPPPPPPSFSLQKHLSVTDHTEIIIIFFFFFTFFYEIRQEQKQGLVV